MAVNDTSAALKYELLITSEHNRQPKFMALINVLTQAMAEINAGILSIQAGFDLDTAMGVQLDIVGLWIGQPRIVPNVLVMGFFGFLDNLSALRFGELSDRTIGGYFYDMDEPFSSTTTLQDQDYRAVLRAVIVRNQSKGSITDIERALSYMFSGASRITDTGVSDLTIKVASAFAPTSLALVVSNDILPRPAATSISSITFG